MNFSEQREPSENELRAMAYVDGELSQEDARQFESELAGDPALAREVAELKALELVSRQMAPPEPMDYEWERLSADPLQRTGVGLGFGLLIIGAIGLALWGIWSIAFHPDLSLPTKCFSLATILGLLLIFLTVLRGRLRTLPYDPYTKIKR